MLKKISFTLGLGIILIPALVSARTIYDFSPEQTSQDAWNQPAPAHGRPWGPEQATGEPDTVMAGDMQTAWASLTEDGQDEWILLTYKKSMVPMEIIIHETYNPGAVYRVTGFDGRTEVELWTGADPVVQVSGQGISTIPVQVAFPISKVKVYLHSKDIPGWNEIDAVGMKDKNGTVQWAHKARASSTYANQPPPPPDPMTLLERRVKQLEEEVAKLKRRLGMNG